jgi:hypothetical protein
MFEENIFITIGNSYVGNAIIEYYVNKIGGKIYTM